MIRDDLIKMYCDVKRMHEQMQGLLANVKMEANLMDPSIIVDATYVLKRANEYIDGTRKDVNRALEHVQKLGCMIVMQQSDNKLVGEIASGYAQTKETPALPDREKNPEAYFELMAAMGVPDELANSGLIKPSFTGVGNFATKLAEDGIPLPSGLRHATMISSYTVAARAKAGIDLDVLASKV